MNEMLQQAKSALQPVAHLFTPDQAEIYEKVLVVTGRDRRCYDAWRLRLNGNEAAGMALFYAMRMFSPAAIGGIYQGSTDEARDLLASAREWAQRG